MQSSIEAMLGDWMYCWQNFKMGRDFGECHLQVSEELTVLELVYGLVMDPLLLLMHLDFRVS